MLLPNMTHEEERSEILKDLPNVERYNRHRWKNYYKVSLRIKDFPKFVFTEYVSPRKNRWLISTKIVRKDSFSSTFGVIQRLNGLVLHQVFCSIDEEKYSTICTFIPHFFERYKEYNQLELDDIPLIKQFLKDDCSFNVDRTQDISGRKERDKENNIHCCMRLGVGLGYELGYRHYLIKTFVTYDMSKGRQKRIFEATRDDVTRPLTSQTLRKRSVMPPPLLLSEEEIKKAIKKFGKF